MKNQAQVVDDHGVDRSNVSVDRVESELARAEGIESTNSAKNA